MHHLVTGAACRWPGMTLTQDKGLGRNEPLGSVREELELLLSIRREHLFNAAERARYATLCQREWDLLAPYVTPEMELGSNPSPPVTRRAEIQPDARRATAGFLAAERAGQVTQQLAGNNSPTTG
jgi:hypothetical protein